MHPALASFIERFEHEAQKAGRYRVKIGHAEFIFLEKVWGPVFQFKFDGLRAEYPFKDAKGGDRFVDFMYEYGGIRLIIEIDGYSSHAKHISSGDFDDHLDRQNDLLLAGWFLLRFSARQVEQHSETCRSKLQQALGNRWVQVHGIVSPSEVDPWEQRLVTIKRMATNLNGTIRAIDVATAFQIQPRTAQKWMKRFTDYGWFVGIGTPSRNTAYRLMEGGK